MSWPPRDWRAMTALLFSVLGAAVLTAFVWWGFWQLLPGRGWSLATEPHRARTLRWVLWIASATIGASILGLGMAINRRSFRGNIGGSGFDFKGGEGDPATPAAAAQATAQAAERKADEIARQTELPRPRFGVDDPDKSA